jgi:hypothetical protein
VRAPADLVDLNTAFDVLGTQLLRFQAQYSSCSSTAQTCTQTFASEMARQFATLVTNLAGQSFPPAIHTEVSAMESTARELEAIAQAVADGQAASNAGQQLARDEERLVQEFQACIRG